MLDLVRRTSVAAAALAAVAATSAGVVGLTGSAADAAAAVPGCHAADLAISLGRLDAGLGSRYQDVRIANVSGHDCRLTGYPTFRFGSEGHPVGFRSQHQGQDAGTVRLQVGDSAWTTLWFTDPGPVPAGDCDATEATSLRLRLPHRPHLYRLAFSAPICTTKEYRPVAYPVRDRAVY